MSSLLLHSCCGPCSVIPLQIFADQNRNLDIFYCNPNIHPQAEYLLRLETLQKHAQDIGVRIHVARYQPELWEANVGVLGGPYPLIEGSADFDANNQSRKQRCTACYRLRFEQLAEFAANQGYQSICTTLSISPYQYIDIIKDVIIDCADKYGINAEFKDFREYFNQATKRSRELGMYRQNYCGCRYSDLEAQIERQARKELKNQKRKQN
jgi:predicted adenine nucleotide alpha hydrolase (AANH) superfamily ATPase